MEPTIKPKILFHKTEIKDILKIMGYRVSGLGFVLTEDFKTASDFDGEAFKAEDIIMITKDEFITNWNQALRYIEKNK